MSANPVQPIRDAVIPEKQGARRHYGSHPYFTKRAWNVVQEYIKRFSSPGDTVLDSFGGSGVTAVESLVLRRKAIYVDISQWACFLARQTAVAPVDVAGLQRSFGRVEDDARAWIEEIWSKPDSEFAGKEVGDWYPKGVRLPSNADVDFVEDLFTPRMLHGLARLRAAIVRVEEGAHRELLLMAFSSTLARINRTFLSTSDRAESRGGSAIFSLYRYKTAKQPVELPLWEQFSRRVLKLIEAKRETNRLIGRFYREGETARFCHGSATALEKIVEPESVDYVYTDPPYGAHISYLDLSTMWAAWLGFEIKPRDRDEEVIEGGELHKSPDVYNNLLARSLEQTAVALKRGGWLSVVFAHRDTTYWERLVEACRLSGLEYVNTVVQPVGVVWSMHKKKNPLRVLSGELVLNFRKTCKRPRRVSADPSVSAVSLVLGQCEIEIIRTIGATTESLHHAVIPCLLEHGLLREFSREHGDLTPLLEAKFDFDDSTGRWHLRDDARVKAPIEMDLLVRYYIARFLQSSLHAKAGATESQIRRFIEPRTSVSLLDQEIRALLEAVAITTDGLHWKLRGTDAQHEFNFC